MKEIKAPEIITKGNTTIFLAGSIEMNTAAEWQRVIIEKLQDKDVTILNPRRLAWDSTWVQDISNPEFNAQVNWELDGLLDAADIVCFYFDGQTKSPISLLELGLALASQKKVLVFCPEKYWRHGNVEITCKRFGVEIIEDDEIFVRKLFELL